MLADAAGTHRFSVDDYHRMLDAGILLEGEPVELLEGYVVLKAPETRPIPTTGFFRYRGLRRFTPSEYHTMLDTGILIEGEPVELLEGYLVNKMGRNAPHETSLRRLMNFLPRQLPAELSSQFQCAVWFRESEPEPDGVVLRGPLTQFDGRVPSPSDVAIAIEVSASSLLLDRRDKGRIYARAGIPVYWIINVIDRLIEVYTDPESGANPPAYRSRTDYKPGDTLPITVDGQVAGTIAVDDLLP